MLDFPLRVVVVLDPEGLGWRWLQQCYSCVAVEAVQLNGAWSEGGEQTEKDTGNQDSDSESSHRKTDDAVNSKNESEYEDKFITGRKAKEFTNSKTRSKKTPQSSLEVQNIAEIVENCVSSGSPLLVRLDQLGWPYLAPLHCLMKRTMGELYVIHRCHVIQ